MELNKYRVDPNREEDGVWVDYRDGSQLKICSIRSNRFRRIKERIEKPYERHLRRGTLPQSKIDELTSLQLAEGCLVDWKGIFNDETELPYSRQAAFDLIYNESWFREDVILFATDEAIFRREDIEYASKNLPTGSDGGSE